MKGKTQLIQLVLLSVLVICSTNVAFAVPHSFSTRSTQADGELKSAGSTYGQYSQGDKSLTRGAIGGGSRGYEWVVNTSKSAPGKRGAQGAVDGVADSGGSSKGATFTTTVQADVMRVGQTAEPNYQIFKAFLSFNTSAIPTGATITKATLIFFGKDRNIEGDIDFDIQLFKSVYTEPLWNPDWGAITGGIRGSVASDDFNFVNGTDPNSGKNIIELTSLSQLMQLIEAGGTTRLALLSSRTSSTTPTTPNGEEFVEIYSSEAANKALRPRLEIDYEGGDLNVYPILGWISGDTVYRDKSVDQEEIYAGTTTLSFRVRYVYDDGQGGLGLPPDSAKVWVDLNNNNVVDADDEQENMVKVDPNDLDYSDGVDYQAQVKVESDASTDVGYEFLFSIGTGEAVKLAKGVAAGKKIITSIADSKDSSDSKTCFIGANSWSAKINSGLLLLLIGLISSFLLISKLWLRKAESTPSEFHPFKENR